MSVALAFALALQAPAAPTAEPCRLIAGGGDVLAFRIERRGAGPDEEIRVIPEGGTPWPRSASGWTRRMEGQAHRVRFRPDAGGGDFILALGGRYRFQDWASAQVMEVIDGEEGLPVAFGQCGHAAAAPQAGAAPTEAGIADRSRWVQDCAVLTLDGRRTRIRYRREQPNLAVLEPLDSGVWPVARYEARRMSPPSPPRRGRIFFGFAMATPSEDAAGPSITERAYFDEAAGEATILLQFRGSDSSEPSGDGFGICALRGMRAGR